MRVLVNELQALKAKTGIGHYTSELLRRLREQAGDDGIATFPGPWLRMAQSLGRRAAGWLRRGPAESAAIGSGRWRRGARFRRARSGRGLLGADFRLRRLGTAPTFTTNPTTSPLPRTCRRS